MARALSEEKRRAIMEQAKRLFADKGFAATSVADIARIAGLPVGSIYTYFRNKEEIVRAIVDEGWTDLRERLFAAMAETAEPDSRLRLLVDQFLPELLTDVDFITILLSEGIEYTRVEEKVDELSVIVNETIGPLAPSASLKNFSATDMEAALMVYFLGTLDAVRIAKRASLRIKPEDVLSFLRLTIRNGLGVSV
jgi:AcrR family transcriptional regulator